MQDCRRLYFSPGLSVFLRCLSVCLCICLTAGCLKKVTCGSSWNLTGMCYYWIAPTWPHLIIIYIIRLPILRANASYRYTCVSCSRCPGRVVDPRPPSLLPRLKWVEGGLKGSLHAAVDRPPTPTRTAGDKTTASLRQFATRFPDKWNRDYRLDRATINIADISALQSDNEGPPLVAPCPLGPDGHMRLTASPGEYLVQQSIHYKFAINQNN